ncbi:MAG: T9SS type A sorting domain-containing protein [Bacteroidetes bacterium]|nr:T9SS type A sorting domain-containing protein [Bacteroidota bacterium]
MLRIIIITALMILSMLTQVMEAQNANLKMQLTNSHYSRMIPREQKTNYNPVESSVNNTGRLWKVPFASKGNTISLSVQNNSSIEAKNVSVTFISSPSWLQFKSDQVIVKTIQANTVSDAVFTFAVERQAPIGKDTTLIAVIKTSSGQSLAKAIRISVEAPKEYKLYNNYPNPFNPSTKIAFELPKAEQVKLTIYDILGNEVVQLENEELPAGYHEVTWNGMNSNGEQVSSGVYLYRLSTKVWSKVMKMMVVK